MVVDEIGEELKVNENPVFSPTRLSMMDDCHKKYWFNYVLKYKSYKIPSSVVIGKHNHKIIEKMWVEDSKTRMLVPGYKSRESCKNIAGRDWKLFFAKRGVSDGKEIEWTKYDGNGWGKGLINRIRETAGIAYNRAMGEKPRLRAEFSINVDYEGLKFSSIIDEVRSQREGNGKERIVIRDHKTGAGRIGEYFVQKNLQLTLNSIVLFEALQHKYSEVSRIFPKYQGIPLDEFLDVLTVEINDVFPWREKGVLKENTEIFSSKRTEQDFNEALIAAEAAIESLRDRDFHPNKGYHCDMCFFKKVCDDYNPSEYHKNDFEKNFPLFVGTGLIAEKHKSNKKTRRYQKSFRFKENNN